MSSCSGVVVGEDGVNWDELKDCEPLPLSIILLLFISACWGFFFIVTGIRRLKHSLSATRDTVVVKKLQHVQIWFYSYFYNLTYLTSIFALISYVLDSYFIASGCIVLGVLISTAINSEIDVVGDVSRKPGVNEVSGTIAFEYLITSYLPKAVWKASGHREFEKKTSSDTALSKKTSFSKALSNIFLCGNSDNHITPKVYDVKDVAGIQGAFLGLPALFVYFLTLIRSTSEGEEFLVGNVTQFSDVYSILEMNVMIKVAASMALLSALLPPMLGDWELFARDMGLGAGKTILYTGLSVSKRLIELTGRVGFYLYFVDTTKFGGLILFTVELFLMFATYINTRDSPSGGRTYTNSHYLLTAVESTFFGFYRRISVDKEFVTHGVQMSPTIELIRYIIKGVATSAGYLMLLGFDFPDTYVEFKHGVDMLPAMFFVGLGANVLLALETIIEFVGFRRKQLDRKELGRLTTYWKSWWLCSKVLCPSTVVHVNRDDNMGTINYV